MSRASRASSILAGSPSRGPWETILNANIVGCYNLFEAARRAGRRARRVRVVEPRRRLLPARNARSASTAPVRPGFALRRQQGVRRGARCALCLQARTARDLPAHRQCCRHAGRQAPAVDLDHRPRIWCSSSASGSSIRISVMRSSSAPPTMRARSWDNEAAFRYGYRPTGPRRGSRRRSARRQRKARAGSGRRLVSGRPLLQRRVRRRHRALADLTPH